jgi:hypothetical protein
MAASPTKRKSSLEKNEKESGLSPKKIKLSVDDTITHATNIANAANAANAVNAVNVTIPSLSISSSSSSSSSNSVSNSASNSSSGPRYGFILERFKNPLGNDLSTESLDHQTNALTRLYMKEEDALRDAIFFWLTHRRLVNWMLKMKYGALPTDSQHTKMQDEWQQSILEYVGKASHTPRSSTEITLGDDTPTNGATSASPLIFLLKIKLPKQQELIDATHDLKKSKQIIDEWKQRIQNKMNKHLTDLDSCRNAFNKLQLYEWSWQLTETDFRIEQHVFLPSSVDFTKASI